MTQITKMSRYCIEVGGWVFVSTAETLSQSPVIKQLIFDAGEDMPFIDRDGGRFQYVLDYLRTGTVYPLVDSAYLASLVSEAQFYGLEHMTTELERLQRINAIVGK